jgi:hypothetical protein
MISGEKYCLPRFTPFPRYLNGYCCATAGHCAHLAIQDAREKIFADLTRLHSFISNRLSSFPNCKVIAAGDLLVNKAKAPTSATTSRSRLQSRR